MAQATQSQSSIPTTRSRVRRRRHSLWHAVVLLLLTLSFTGLGILGFAWWQDRPFRELSGLLAREDYQGSLRLADHFLADHPHDTRVKILKARTLSALGQHASADSLFQQVALHLDGFPDDPAALRCWSESLLHLQQWSRAISIQETLLESFPADADILYRLTVARIRLLQYDDALKSAKRLAAIPGQEQQANVMIGTIHHDQGNGHAALEAWEKVLAKNPEADGLQIPAGEFWAMIGEVLLESGSPQRSASLLERSVESLPKARSYALLGRAYSQLDRQPEAIQAWEQALLHDSRDPIALEELANVALRSDQAQRAVELIMPLTTTSELQSSSAYILQRAYSQLKQPDKSIVWRDRANLLRDAEKNRSTLNELIRNSHDPFWSAFLRVYQLADQQQWENAEKRVNDLLLQHSDESLLLQLAEAIRKRGQLPALDSLTNQKY